MSELFDDDARDEPADRPPPSRRSRALVITAVVLVLAFFALTTFANFYTNVLWYRDVGFGGVYSRLLWTKIALFAVFGLLMAVVVVVNMVIAFRVRPLFHPQSPEQSGLDRYRQAVTPIRTWLVIGVGVLLGLFAGTSGAGEWRNFMLWRHGVAFDREDAYFGKDIGFFVFDLPWYHFLTDFVMAMSVVALLAAAVVHYLYGGIRLQTPADRLSGAAQAQLSVLLGVFVLAKALDYWLDRYDLAYQSGSLLTGITYTDDNAVLPAKSILMGIALICAVLFFLNIWRRTWLLPSMGLALLVLSAILLGLIWPGIVQQFQVKPSEADKEAPYIEKNIAATRAAYDIDTVEEYKLPAAGTPATEVDAETDPGITSIPLMDPALVRQVFQQNQQVRGYYSTADVLDVDHYEIDGVDRALVLGVRELDQNALNSDVKNWLNLHTVYTHGNDVIAAFANQRTASNQELVLGDTDKTQWAEGNQLGQDALGDAVGDYEDRVYFGEHSPDYSVVGKASEGAQDVELNLSKAASADEGDDQAAGDGGDEAATGSTTTYTGKGGVPVGSTFRQLLYAIKFGSTNFLLSGRVNENSEVIYNRDPKDRVQKVAPWLTLDDDAYPAIVDGKILWIVDGYTTTDRFPGSERESFKTMTDDTLQDETGLRTLPTDEINYMRNSVKATVDAYDGTVTLYAWDDQDPLLKAWSDAFPGTVEPKSKISDELLEHLRYPEDMFKVQRYQFARYHVTDPNAWFQDNNRWEVPEDPNGAKAYQPPYRMFVTQPPGLVPSPDNPEGLPDVPTGQVWSMTSTFVPYKRLNLAAYVSVDSDATSKTYGQMRVIDVIDEQQQGPSQVANSMQSDPDVSERLAEFNRSGNSLTYGNLLTVPLGDELMYVEPVYARRATASEANFPILRYVLVSYKGGVGLGLTLQSALETAIANVDDSDGGPSGEPTPSDEPTPTDEPTDEPTAAISGDVDELLAEAQNEFVLADQALSQGNLAEFQEHYDKARDLVAQAVSQSGGGSGGGEPTGTSSPSGSSPSPTP
ncbi:UPF0182 family protein [Nocardioides halotolerans]|uniref:UPF0182 family membrane protein n=1 Tax=Nocardioides halotolerans TaxID=433660 RepID=UPI0004290C21|nr:UPF0182 family protein [Nocardioides halotolerans]